MTEETLQKEREALEKKSRLRKNRQKNRRRRAVRAVCAGLLLLALFAGCVCAAGLFRQENQKSSGEASAPAETVDVLSIGMENGQYRTVTLSSGVTTTLEDYESEYVQFGLGAPVLLPSGVLDETGEDVADMLGVPAGQEAPETPAPTPSPTPALPEEDDAQSDGGAAAYVSALEEGAEGEGEYAAVSADDVIVAVLPSREDFDWAMEHVLNGCGTSERAVITRRGTKETVQVYLVSDVPEEELLTREEGYLLLSDLLTLCWTEKEVKEEAIEPETIYFDDEALAQGKTKVDEPGSEGRAKNTYAVSYEGGKEVGRERTAHKVLSEAAPKIVLRGVKAPAKTTPAPTKKPSSAGSSSSSSAAPTPTPASGASGVWPGTNIGKGSDYPNIDKTLSRPGPDQGVMGPDSGALSFRYPVDEPHISSNFGWRYGRMHYGVDIFLERNSPIYASESGTVTSYTGTHTGYGLIVEIDHGGGFTTRYAHCEALLVKAGQTVQKGDVIALVGSTAVQESGPHCHFEIRQNGVPYNPRFYLKK